MLDWLASFAFNWFQRDFCLQLNIRCRKNWANTLCVEFTDKSFFPISPEIKKTDLRSECTSATPLICVQLRRKCQLWKIFLFNIMSNSLIFILFKEDRVHKRYNVWLYIPKVNKYGSNLPKQSNNLPTTMRLMSLIALSAFFKKSLQISRKVIITLCFLLIVFVVGLPLAIQSTSTSYKDSKKYKGGIDSIRANIYCN